MLDLKLIRENPDQVRDSIRRRGLKVDLDKFLKLDVERSRLTQEVDTLRSQLKQGSQPGPEELQKLRDHKARLSEQEEALATVLEQWGTLYRQIPNLIHPEVPAGTDDSANQELRKVGEPPSFDFTPKDHLELGTALDLIDFERGAKVSGGQFYFLKNEAVELELALVRYAVDLLKDEGFTLMDTPDLARNEVLEGVGFMPRGEESNVYNVEGSDLSLVATAEIPLAGYHSDEILDLSKPVKYAGISRCFRREAGSYGQESRGLYRVHQFTKLEMFIYSRPDQSDGLHEYLLNLEEELLQGLEVSYRVVDVCAGDLGASAYRKFDIEAWMPGRSSYGEVTSTSNTTDYQARRLRIRYRDEAGTRYAHTLNGTAIAISRTLLALLENHQQADGSVGVPEALHPYLSFTEIKR